jgi:predicted O-linked N-acetylglucosamine transferase (SPINDLY family)
MSSVPTPILQELLQHIRENRSENLQVLVKHAIGEGDPSMDYLFQLGIACASNNKLAEAIVIFESLQVARSQDVRLPYNLGLLYSMQGKHQAALIAYERALSIQPSEPDVLINSASSLVELRRYQEAIPILDLALSLNPHIPEAWSNKGMALSKLNLYQESIEAYDQALELNPNFCEAWSNRSVPLIKLKRYSEAILACDKALMLKPDYSEALSNKGNALLEQKRYQEALSYFDQALSLKPGSTEALANKATTLHELRLFDEALIHFDRALSFNPNMAEVWASRAMALTDLKRHTQAAESYFKALELSPDEGYWLGRAHHQMMFVCNWSNYEEITQKIFQGLEQGKKVAEPFGFQGIATSEMALRKCAEIYSSEKFPSQAVTQDPLKYNHHKIRIGYLCGEFRKQATAILLARIWELHDKNTFEIYAFDSGYDDGSDYRSRIKIAFPHFFDISQLADADAVQLIRENEIDILVNLNGFFGHARPDIFASRAAPIQVNYLGFPGTLGVPYMDYIIADKVVIPEASRDCYVEKVAYLPNSYQANDELRVISQQHFSRAELGLPENGFVFCCFNNNYKITPSTLDLWSRILKQVKGSILWLLEDSVEASKNILSEARKRGVAEGAIIFAPRLPLEEHLARHKAADLFLDTLPYNAHTTASDALWAGLPVLTLSGSTFPARVGASLLNALQLPELIVSTEAEFEYLAIELAVDPSKLQALTQKLARNRLSAPLFNSQLFTNHIELAYMEMIGRYRSGLPPAHISIEIS